MMEWFSANWGTILAVAILALIVGFAIRTVVKDKKTGRSSCGAGCAGCAMRGACHKKTGEK